MENHHFLWENSLYMAIFNSYVKLPEGKKTKFIIIELDDGKFLTGKPDQFHGKNHGFL